MKKKIKKPMFFFRILRLIRNRKNKKAVRALEKSTIKVFIQTHDWLLWGIKYILPFIITVLFIMMMLIIALVLGFRFYSETNAYIWIGIGGVITFLLFYKIIEDLVKEYLEGYWLMYL